MLNECRLKEFCFNLGILKQPKNNRFMNLRSLNLLWMLGIAVACSSGKNVVTSNDVIVDAPFDMPNIVIPDFSRCDTLIITAYGASESDKDKTSQAIADAINEANQRGGGVVMVPKGKWPTGKIHFKSNVNLFLADGAELVFSDDPNDYLPAVHTTWEGMECFNYSPLIYAYQCDFIAITGKGMLRAEMETWKSWFSRPPAHMNSLKRLYTLASENSPVEDRQMVNDSSHLRPQFIQFNRCNHVLLENVHIQNSPFWVIHPYLSRNIVIRGVHVQAHGHNNDGVDPDMCQNMLIEHCVFDQGDDAIAVKAGRNQDAWRLHTPTQYLVIRNCKVLNGHQLLAIGSELSGGVEKVYMDSCQVVEGAKLNHLVFIKTNERRGGFVRDIYVDNIRSGKIDKGILGIETDVLYQWRDLVPTYERRLTDIENIYLDNVHASDVHFIAHISGQKEQPVHDITLRNVVADTITDQAYRATQVRNFKHE